MSTELVCHCLPEQNDSIWVAADTACGSPSLERFPGKQCALQVECRNPAHRKQWHTVSKEVRG